MVGVNEETLALTSSSTSPVQIIIISCLDEYKILLADLPVCVPQTLIHATKPAKLMHLSHCFIFTLTYLPDRSSLNYSSWNPHLDSNLIYPTCFPTTLDYEAMIHSG